MENIHFLDRAEGVDGVDVSFPEPRRSMVAKWGGRLETRIFA